MYFKFVERGSSAPARCSSSYPPGAAARGVRRPHPLRAAPRGTRARGPHSTALAAADTVSAANAVGGNEFWIRIEDLGIEIRKKFFS